MQRQPIFALSAQCASFCCRTTTANLARASAPREPDDRVRCLCTPWQPTYKQSTWFYSFLCRCIEHPARAKCRRQLLASLCRDTATPLSRRMPEMYLATISRSLAAFQKMRLCPTLWSQGRCNNELAQLLSARTATTLGPEHGLRLSTRGTFRGTMRTTFHARPQVAMSN